MAGVRLRGPKNRLDRIVDVRPMTRDDLARLDGPRAKPGAPQRIRNSHHMIARLSAAGLRNWEVANRVGYTKERVGQLLASPAMKELVAQYQAVVDEEFRESIESFVELGTANMIAAQRHIRDKIDQLDEEGELLSIREAIAVSSDLADRLGYGKKQTNVNVNVDFAARLESAIARRDKQIEGKVERAPQPPPAVAPSALHPTPPSLAMTPRIAPSSREPTALAEPTPELSLRRRA